MSYDVKEQLLHPDVNARGYTRWWWFGCAVTRDEIMRELDYMQEAGIGGVELQILYPVEVDDPAKNVKNNFFLSPGYLEYIRFAVQEANKRGMKFDVTLGSSWPYGGPFVPMELSAPNVIPYTIDIEGPCTYSCDFTTLIYGECVGCVIGKMENSQMIPETIRDITEEVKDRYLFEWEWGKKIEGIPVPEGNHKLVLFISNEKRQTVLKPAAGGDGLIIDHNRKEALRFFLEQSADPIHEAAGEFVQSYFCDSIEVFGQNWTDIIYDEFRKRRGYELRPYIYALWGNVKGFTDLVRYDFQKTLGELTVENFFRELTQWCHEKGRTSRIQAHGTWGDILQAYGAADIPEGETFSAFDRYEVNTIHRRLAVSAGHIYDKPIISNETFTWLRFPRFIVTLEHMKAAVDSVFLDGMNQIVNHGYAYSPKEAGVPGWSFYASSHINHTNPWWEYYPHLSRYINRVSDFIRRGKTKTTLAIYLPQADIWAESPLADIHMCLKLEERLTTKVVDRIHKEGFWFDYVNDEALENLADRGYEALLFLETDRIPEESAKNAARYVQQGGKIICSGHTPLRSCGLVDYEKKTEQVQQIFRKLTDDGVCVVTDGSLEGLLDELHRQVSMDVVISWNKDTIGFVHQEDGERDIYFITNISDEWRDERLVFCNQDSDAQIYDPMTAEEAPVKSVAHGTMTSESAASESATSESMASELVVHEPAAQDASAKDGSCGSGTVIELTFRPFQSLLFVFDKTVQPEYRPYEAKPESVVLDISEGWDLTVAERGFSKHYTDLNSWEKEEPLRYYSGNGCYERSIFVSAEQLAQMQGHKVYLQLEHLGETATVTINEKEAGVLLMRPYLLDISGLLVQGENKIRIRVTNLLINQVIDPDAEELEAEGPVIDRWPYNTEHLNQCRRERIFGWRERKMIKEPLPSGLWGKIQIVI